MKRTTDKAAYSRSISLLSQRRPSSSAAWPVGFEPEEIFRTTSPRSRETPERSIYGRVIDREEFNGILDVPHNLESARLALSVEVLAGSEEHRLRDPERQSREVGVSGNFGAGPGRRIVPTRRSRVSGR